MHWAGVCSRSFQILSVPDALALTCLSESHLAGCHSQRRRSGSITSALAAHATATFLNSEKSTYSDESAPCLRSLRAYWLLRVLPVGSGSRNITKAWSLRPPCWT